MTSAPSGPDGDVNYPFVQHLHTLDAPHALGVQVIGLSATVLRCLKSSHPYFT